MPDYTLEHGGVERDYHLIVPPGSVERALPLVFILHGGGGTGPLIARITRIAPVAQSRGFLVCCPSGLNKQWNDGRAVDGKSIHNDGVDDVGFIHACIEDIATRHAVDRNRIFAAGASNGAMLTYRMAIERPETFAAVCGVMCPLHVPFCREHRPKAPLPMLFIQGTADPVCPFEGGPIQVQRKQMGEVMSFRDSVRYWVEANECGAVPEEELVAEASDDQPMRVWREWYPGDHEVAAYIVEGGGHTWPGGEQYAPEFVIGKTCAAFSASELLWDFFTRHSRA